MKIVYTADLHGNLNLYKELFMLAAADEPGAVIIGGDLLPKRGPVERMIEEQRDFITEFLRPELERFHAGLPDCLFYAMMGNDDWQVNMPFLEKLQEEGLLKLMHDRIYDLAEYQIIGYGHVPPTPFSNKDFERIDRWDAPREPQLSLPCISVDRGITAIDAESYFKTHPTIEEELDRLPVPRSYERAIYVTHAPPFGTKLDVLYDGRSIGSRAVRRFIEERQPLLTLHGHIHEAPLRSGTYRDRIGNTLSVNPGQSTERLQAVVFELNDPGGTMTHSLFH